MDATQPHQRRGPRPRSAPRAPLEPLAPSTAQRVRGVVGFGALTVAMGVAVAVAIALVLVVAAVVAITTLG